MYICIKSKGREVWKEIRFAADFTSPRDINGLPVCYFSFSFSYRNRRVFILFLSVRWYGRRCSVLIEDLSKYLNSFVPVTLVRSFGFK